MCVLTKLFSFMSQLSKRVTDTILRKAEYTHSSHFIMYTSVPAQKYHKDLTSHNHGAAAQCMKTSRRGPDVQPLFRPNIRTGKNMI